jgi:hypothetical protein
MGISLEEILPYASFALAVAGLVVRIFLRSDSRKSAMLIIVLTLLVVMTGLGSYRAFLHARHVEAAAETILTKLGNQTKTFEEIHEDFIETDPNIIGEALESLVETGRVDHKIMDVRDDLGTRFRVRGYFAKDTGKGRP